MQQPSKTPSTMDDRNIHRFERATKVNDFGISIAADIIITRNLLSRLASNPTSF